MQKQRTAHARERSLTAGRPFAVRGPLTPAALIAQPGALEAIPSAMFCAAPNAEEASASQHDAPSAAAPHADARVRALAARGLAVAPWACAGDAEREGPVRLLRQQQRGGSSRADADAASATEQQEHSRSVDPAALSLPCEFRDVTHALQVALFAEWRCGAPLASLSDGDAAAAAAGWEAHDAQGRGVVAALLGRWRAAGALFGAE
jgi:hypothetical protein